MSLKSIAITLLLATAATFTVKAQDDVALKTNLIADALLSPNLGIEIGLAPHWSLDVRAQGNFWDVKGHLWKHMLAQPEARYWFCQRFAGHFICEHAIGGVFNIGNINLDKLAFLGNDFKNMKDHRYEGWGIGGGITYGYAWPVHRHWNIEAEIGVGYVYTRHDTYPCASCGRKIANNVPRNYVGPTKAGVNVVYIF